MKEPMLIGSRALSIHSGRKWHRDNSDYDVITEPNRFLPDYFEIHHLNFLNNSDMLVFDSGIRIRHDGIDMSVMSMQGLAIMKRSHLWRDLFFDKHITHYHKSPLADSFTALSDAEMKIYTTRLAMTKKAFPVPHPKLNVPVSEFFDDYVEKKYDHDMLHGMVASPDEPMYTRLQRNRDTAWCHEDLWRKLSHAQMVRCVFEEATVIAIERFMVPKNWAYPPKLAYMRAVRMICTHLCSGWFRDFAIDNYPQVIDSFDADCFERIKKFL